jgi:hypothetical protein
MTANGGTDTGRDQILLMVEQYPGTHSHTAGESGLILVLQIFEHCYQYAMCMINTT